MSRTAFYWLSLLLAVPCLCHKRLHTPMPRDTSTGPRSSAPCGGTSFEAAYQAGRVTDWDAGETVEIVVYEQIYHSAQPMRLAISSSNDEDFDSCIWLNHIPQHNRNTEPKNMTIKLTVPDMDCKNCTLQLMAFETGGLSDDSCCAYHNNGTKTCALQQYYSCANININGGSRDREDVCVQPESWSFRDLPCNYYRGETSTDAWEADGGNNLKLKMSGVSGVPSESEFCGTSELSIDRHTGCQAFATDFRNLALLEGGDMSADGVFAVVLVILLLIVIPTVYCVSKRKEANAAVTTA